MNYQYFSKAVIVIIAFICIGTSCTKTTPEEIPEPVKSNNEITPTPVKIKLGATPYFSNTIFLIAEKEGFFAEQGLDVEIIPIKSINNIIPMLLNEDIDVSAPGLSAAFFNAVSRGGNIKIIMPLTDFTVKECSTIAYLARTEDVEANTYDDLRNWTKARMVVSINGLNSTPGYVLGNALATVDLTVDDVQIEVVDLPAQEEALRTGQIDIVYAVEPWITRMTAQGDISILTPAEQYAPDLTSSIVVAGPKILDNPDVGNRFAIAYLKAVRQFMEGPTERNIALAVEHTGLSKELVEQICWSNTSPNGVMNMDSLMDYKNWLIDRGLLDEDVIPEKFYDSSFVDHAVQIIGTINP